MASFRMSGRSPRPRYSKDRLEGDGHAVGSVQFKSVAELSKSPIEGRHDDSRRPCARPRLSTRSSSSSLRSCLSNGSSCSRSSAGARRSVVFSSKVRVRVSLMLSDYTDAELRATWYDIEELDRIRTENKRLMDRHLGLSEETLSASSGTAAAATSAAGVHRPQHDVCVRGLEGRVPRVHKQRIQRRMLARQAVFEEQAMLASRSNGEATAERIAARYGHATRESQVAAFRIARMDHRDAAKS